MINLILFILIQESHNIIQQYNINTPANKSKSIIIIFFVRIHQYQNKISFI